MQYQLKSVALAALVAVTAAGCNPTATVSGEVSYDGTPIENGTIVFMPADGNGTAASGTIEKGAYSVHEVVPGPKVVQIIATKRVQFARTTEDLAQEFAARKGKKAAPPESALAVPRDAGGNNQRAEVTPGKQTLNFALTKLKK